MTRHKITIQPASEAELANITLLVPGNRPTAGRRYRRRHCSTRPFGMHTAAASSALLSGAASRGQRSCRCILSGTKRLSHDRARRRRDSTVTPSGCWSSAGRPHRPVSMRDWSPITNPLRPKTAGFLMDNRDCSSPGGRETVAAQRNNTLADIWPKSRMTPAKRPSMNSRSP